MNKEEIRKQAKKIIDEFMSALKKSEEIEEKVGFDRKEFVRNGKKQRENEGFKVRALKNAPKKRGNYFVAEKKKW